MKKWLLLVCCVFLMGCERKIKCTQENPCVDGYDKGTGTEFGVFTVVKRKDDRIDRICGDSQYVMCLIATDSYGYSGHKRDFAGCGCGDTKAQATAMCLSGLVNQGFYVDFDILGEELNLSDQELLNKVFDYTGVEY